MSDSCNLKEAFDNYFTAYDLWANDPNTDDHPDGRYWEALERLFIQWNMAEIPEKFHCLYEAIVAFRQEFGHFDQSGAPNPSFSYWNAHNHLRERYKATSLPPKRRETVKELAKQEVPHWQIARIWGLKNDDGSDAVHLVEAELLEPGSVITKDYVHPDDKVSDYPKDLTIAPIVPEFVELEINTAPEETPESLVELVSQEILAPQIAKMKGIEQDEAEFYVDEWNQLMSVPYKELKERAKALGINPGNSGLKNLCMKMFNHYLEEGFPEDAEAEANSK